jgi:hypothetical protein
MTHVPGHSLSLICFSNLSRTSVLQAQIRDAVSGTHKLLSDEDPLIAVEETERVVRAAVGRSVIAIPKASSIKMFRAQKI